MKKNLFIVSVLLVLVVFPVFPMSTGGEALGDEPKPVEVINTPDTPIPTYKVGVEPIVIKGQIDGCTIDKPCRVLICKIPEGKYLRLEYVSIRAATVRPMPACYPVPFAAINWTTKGETYNQVLGLLAYASKVSGNEISTTALLSTSLHFTIDPDDYVYITIEEISEPINNIEIILSALLLEPPFFK